MPNKISIYRAFGQFFRMIEAQENERVQPKFNSERTLLDLFLFKSSSSLAKSTHTCPTIIDDQADYQSVPLRRARSCPLAAGGFDLKEIRAAMERERLDRAGQKMVDFWKLPSSVVSSLSATQLNMATAKMVEFWKIPEQPSLFENMNGLFESESQKECSLFENIGSWNDQKSQTSLALSPKQCSLFENLDGFFDEPAECSLFEKLDGYFEEQPKFLEELAVFFDKNGKAVLSHNKGCLCSKCSIDSEKTWNSVISYPELPVFVKSPVDSLKLYKCCPFFCSTSDTCEDMSAKESDAEGVRDVATSPLFIPRRKVGRIEKRKNARKYNGKMRRGTRGRLMKKENAILRQTVKVQMEIIERMTKLNKINGMLARK